ncbi:hypothetical protein X801_05305, partial [Opisthorchis viverrini]
MYYGSFVTGKIVKDHMSIDGTRIGIVPFGLAEDAPPPQEDDEISGALALAKVGEQPDIPTVLDVMVANKAIKTSIFTLYFTCHRDCLPGGPDAQIIFGEVDPKLYNEPIFYVGLVPSFKWQFMLQRLDIGFFTLLQNVLVEIDTKMPAIVGPIEQVQRINTLLGFHDNERGIYAKPCRLVEEQRDLELVFPHFALPTSSEFYMQRGKADNLVSIVGKFDGEISLLFEISLKFDRPLHLPSRPKLCTVGLRYFTLHLDGFSKTILKCVYVAGCGISNGLFG